MAEIAGKSEIEVKRVFAVCGSTDVAVAGRQPDIDGMMADLAWNLARCRTWAAPRVEPCRVGVGGGFQSFTFDGFGMDPLGDLGWHLRGDPRTAPWPRLMRRCSMPRPPPGHSGCRCTVGTDAGTGSVDVGGRGDVMERLVVDQSVVEAVAPEDWATAIEQ